MTKPVLFLSFSLALVAGFVSFAEAAVVSRVPEAGKFIALTFDACSIKSPSRYDRKVTDALLKYKVPATIFVGGIWAQDEAEHLKFLVSHKQFEIGNHTWKHPHMTKLKPKQIREELQKTQDMIFQVIGIKPKFYRPPYGELDDRSVKVAAKLGLTTIEYDFPSGDPDIHATKEKLIEWVSSRARNGSIVVMHINQRGWHTAEAIPGIVKNLRKKGFTFVTVSELIHRGKKKKER